MRYDDYSLIDSSGFRVAQLHHLTAKRIIDTANGVWIERCMDRTKKGAWVEPNAESILMKVYELTTNHAQPIYYKRDTSMLYIKKGSYLYQPVK